MALTCLSLIVLVTSAYLLVTGSPWLTRTVVESINLPLGTLISWAGIIALPSSIYLVSAKHLSRGARFSRFCRLLLRLDLMLAGSWGLVAYGLAGTWAFTFSAGASNFRGSDQASSVFWTYSIAVAVLPLLVMVLLLASKFFAVRESGIST